MDLTIIVIYLPPDNSTAVANDATAKVLEWAEVLVQRAPARTIPILMGDMNAHVGWTWTEGDQHLEPACVEAVGEVDRQRENFNGAALTRMATRQALSLINTFHASSGATYYGVRNGEHYSSRVDYQLAPTTLLGSTATVTDDEAARALQLIPDARHRDHIPLITTFTDVTLNYKGDEKHPQEIKWDQGAMMKAARAGKGTQ